MTDPKHCCLELDCPGCIIDAKMLRDLQAEIDRQRARAEAAEANYRFMVERAADQKLDGDCALSIARAALREEEGK
jgi:porphobilinogen deaminase